MVIFLFLSIGWAETFKMTTFILLEGKIFLRVEFFTVQSRKRGFSNNASFGAFFLIFLDFQILKLRPIETLKSDKAYLKMLNWQRVESHIKCKPLTMQTLEAYCIFKFVISRPTNTKQRQKLC